MACSLQRTPRVWDASLLASYEILFAILGGGTIVFMVAVVAAGGGAEALPPAFRRLKQSAGRCLVCNAAAGDSWVACTRCDAPYHGDCARYLTRCAVYGCDKSGRVEQRSTAKPTGS